MHFPEEGLKEKEGQGEREGPKEKKAQEEKRYDIFINYNSRDALAVEVLVGRLESQGLQCFRDVWETVPGRGVVPQLLEGLVRSRVVVVFIGRQAIGPWQAREVLSALQERLEGKCLLPVFFPGFPPEEREKLSEFLKSPTQVLFRQHLDEKLPFEQLLKAIEGELKKQTPGRVFVESQRELPRRELKNPYKGLNKFLEKDSDCFFGRQKATREIIEDIERAATSPERVRLFILTGVSGSGKSSLARAGVMAGLRKKWGEEWQYATVGNPGREPLYELALQMPSAEKFEEALLGDKRALDKHICKRMPDTEDGKFVLLIDQFEEIFTLCREDKQRRALLNNLLFASSKDNGKCIVVLTLRNEFLQHFVDMVEEEACNGKAYVCRRSSVPSVGMSRSELREAILGPAHLMGVGYNAALLDGLLEDASVLQEEAEAREGILPLLQVALEELWPYRNPNHIEYDAYKETGGIRGALGKRADDIYGGLNEEERGIAQYIFLNLLRMNPNAPETRQRVRVNELTVQGKEKAAVESVVERLVDGRLLLSDKGEVEIIHEALIHHWSILREWVESSQEGIKRKQQIEDRAKFWQSGEGDLLTGKALASALEWVEEDNNSPAPLGLNTKAREFLEDSKKRQEEERRKENTQLRRQRVAYAVFSAFMTVLATIAAFMWHESNQQRIRADQQRAVAQARRLASSSLLEQNKRVDLSLLLAVASIQEMEATHNPALAESEGALLRTLQLHPQLGSYLHGHTGDVKSLAFSPDGRLLASASWETNFILWDLEKRQALAILSGHKRWVNHLSFSPDGSLLASASADKTIILWEVKEQKALATLRGHEAGVDSVAFSPDGKLLVSFSADKTIILWDVNEQKALTTLRGHEAEILHVAFSPDGKLLASASSDKTVILWDVNERQALKTLHGHDGAVTHLAFSPNGKLLASASDASNNKIILWNLEKQEALATLHGHNEWVTHLAFSPDGSLLASSSYDKTVVLWDLPKQQVLTTLRGHKGWVLHLAFNPAGNLLASASNDQTIILWDLQKHQALATLPGHDGWFPQLFSPDGSLLASTGGGKIILWNVKEQQTLATLRGHDSLVTHLSFSPDGNLLASVGNNQTIILWEVKEQKVLTTLREHHTWISHLSFSPDGNLLASASVDETITLWALNTQQTVATLRGDVGPSIHVSFSPDGRFLASANHRSTITLWDLNTYQAVATLRGRNWVFNPDGHLLAAANDDKTIVLWELNTHQPLATFSGHKEPVERLSFSPDGSLLASASKTIVLWDLNSHQPLTTLRGHDDSVSHLAFSPDGSLLVSASYDKTIILWNLKTHQPVATLRGHEDWVFSPDGRFLASASNEHTLVLWDLKTQQAFATLRGHSDKIQHLSFSPDESHLLVSASDDRTIILWDVKQQQALAIFHEHLHPVNHLSFSPDGKLLASASYDRTLKLWDTSRDSWRARARTIANRNMTLEEWRTHMGERPYRKIFEDLPGPAEVP